MMNDTSQATLQAGAEDKLLQAYEEIAYVGAPNPNSHPERLAVVASLLGIDAVRPSHARVLEIGCGDGANIVPMAAAAPEGKFVAFDFAPTGIAKGRAMVEAIGLRNMDLRVLDIRNLPDDLGPFDYVIAHGFYSWVPDEVRAATLPTIARLLAPHGIGFVSYNVLPGCHLRRAVWDMLKYHTRNLQDPRKKLEAARSLLALVGEPAETAFESDQAMRAEAQFSARQTDSALYHDELSEPNVPVYFHEFLADAQANGLTFLAEAELHSMVGAGITPRVRQALGHMERLEREQYLDFVHCRRFRQSLVTHQALPQRFTVDPQRAATMHVRARRPLRDMAAKNDFVEFLKMPPEKTICELVLSRWPATVPVAEIAELIAGEQGKPGSNDNRPGALVVVQLYSSGLLELSFEPGAAVRVPGERPTTFAPARYQAQQGQLLTNVYHEQLRIDTPLLQELIARLDGTRTRADIMAATEALRREPQAELLLKRALEALARSALLIG